VGQCLKHHDGSDPSVGRLAVALILSLGVSFVFDNQPRKANTIREDVLLSFSAKYASSVGL
jgi:hypothetical protein